MSKVKTGIIGANGYTGLELMRILARHTGVSLEVIASRKEAGARVSAVEPSITAYKDMVYCAPEPDSFNECDVVFSCLPHAASAELCGQLLAKGVKVIDLSADFRYKDLNLYESTYKVTHPHPELMSQAVYGLCEINRTAIKSCSLIGNPGCYTTSAILPLYPLIKEGAVAPKGIIIDSKSGTSGAGKKADVSLIHAEVADSFKAYGVTTHRHTSEIEEVLSLGSDKNVTVSFTPHLLPIKRGILSTIYAPITGSNIESKAHEILNSYYGGEKFVHLTQELPEIKWCANTNNCFIGWRVDSKNNNLIIVSVLDNLLKGASGQAVQNLNIMFGLDESQGLI